MKLTRRVDRLERALGAGASPAAPDVSPEQAELRAIVRRATTDRRMTPDVVAAYARLLLRTDDGEPIEPAPHHALWLELLCDDSIGRLLILAPPDSAKTTWIVSAWLGCYVAMFPERAAILASAATSIAVKRSTSLRTTAETPDWRAAFPGVLPARGMPQHAASWSLAPNGRPSPGRLHPTVSAYGTGGAIVGARADLIVADDLLDFENTRTAHQRETVYQWVHNSLLSRLKAGVGRAVVIGTPWHPDDAYGEFQKMGDFVVCKTPLLHDGPDVYAEVVYPDNWPGRMLGDPIGDAGEEVDDG